MVILYTAPWMQSRSSSPMHKVTSNRHISTPTCLPSSLLSGHEWLASDMLTETFTYMQLSDSEHASKRMRRTEPSTTWEDTQTSKYLARSKTCWNTSLRTAISTTSDQYLEAKISTRNSSQLPRAEIAMPLTSALWKIAFRTSGRITYGNGMLSAQEKYWSQVKALNACNCNHCNSLANQLWSSDLAALASRHGRSASVQSQLCGAHTSTTSSDSTKATSA